MLKINEEKIDTSFAFKFPLPLQFGGSDSVVIIFSDGKKLIHKCISNRLVDNGCSSPRNILQTIDRMEVSKMKTRIIYEITNTEYAKAQ